MSQRHSSMLGLDLSPPSMGSRSLQQSTRSRDRPMAPPSPLGVAHKSGAASSASSAWRGLQGVSIVLRAVLEELVLDELADELAEELQQNKWSKEKLAGWLRNDSSEFSSSTLRSMIAECDSKEVRLLRSLENLVPQMWKGGMFGANVWGGKFGKKAEFL